MTRASWILLGFVCAPLSAQALTVTTATVAGAGTNTGHRPSLAVDSSGDLHVAFAGDSQIRYARRSGGSWSVETVANEIPGALALALDGNGDPHLLYNRSASPDHLRYARKSGGSWTLSTVETGQTFSAVSLAIDGAGHPHIAYYPATDKDLVFGTFDGIRWSTSTVDSAGDVGGSLALALDSQGLAQIAYQDETNSALKYAQRAADGSWTTSTVESGVTPYYIAMVLDGASHPRVSCLRNGLRYLSYDGASWSGTDALSDLSYYTDLALDGAGQPHIVYSAWNGGTSRYDVKTASFTGISWSSHTLEANFNLIGEVSMVLDGNGDSYVAYRDGDLNDLKTATFADGSAPPIGGNPRSRAQAPVGLYADVMGVSSITWHWTDQAANETGFRLSVASASGSGYVLEADSTTLVADTALYIQTGLSLNTSYQAYVAAVSDAGTVVSSSAVRFTLAAIPSNAAFTGVFQDSVTVNWDPAGNREPGTQYQVWLSTESNYLVPSTTTVSTSAVTLTSLLPATTYFVKVRALNGDGIPTGFDASISTSTTVSTDITPPETITTLSSATWSGTPNEIQLRWSTPGDDGSSGTLPAGSGYRIQYSTDDPATVIWSTASAQVEISTQGVAPGVVVSTTLLLSPTFHRFTFRIWTHDERADNWSAPSSTASAFTIPFSYELVNAAASAAPRSAIDRQGNLHMVYTSPGGLAYVVRTGTSWSAATVLDAAGSSGAIAIDGDDHPHIAYYDASAKDLKYANYDGSWHTATLESDDDVGAYTAIAIDAADRPHIAYRYFRDVSHQGLKYAFHDGVVWSTTTVDSTHDTAGVHNTLQLDAMGRPHIAYGNGYYAYFDGSGWVLDIGPTLYEEPSMAIDGNGRVHITSYDTFLSVGFLKYATNAGGSWTDTTVDPPSGGSSEGLGAGSTLRLDGQGRPVIAYVNESVPELRLAIYDGSAWTFNAVNPSTISALTDCNLLLDGSGDAHLGFFQYGSSNLRAGHWIGAGFSPPIGGGSESRLQAPSGLGATVLSGSSVRYDWTDNASNELGFRVYGALSSTGPYTLIAGTTTLSANEETYTESGLVAGTTYYRYVVAVNAGGTTFSQQISVTPSGLPAPGSLAGSALGVSSITWSWSDIANETGYRVISSTGGTLSGNLPAGTVSWTETALSTNSAYTRSAVAYDASGASTSTAVTRYTQAAPPTQTQVASVWISSLTLQWSANAYPAGTSYRVSYWAATGSTQTVTGTSTTVTLGSLSAATTYFFEVLAINGDSVLTSADAVVSTVTGVSPNTSGQVGPDSALTLIFTPSFGEVRLDIPAGAFSQTTDITLSLPSAYPAAVAAAQRLSASGVGVEITVQQGTQPSREVTLTFTYALSALQGLSESRLVIARYDTDRGVWVPLPSTPDPSQHRVVATTRHFSTFQLMEAAPGGSVQEMRAYPNPLRPAQGHTQMTFTSLPAGSTLRIYTLLGNRVGELTADASGTARWAGTNHSGEPVASGVYFVVADGAGAKARMKVAVQR